MRFTVESTELVAALGPAIDIAIKNTSKEFPYAEKITLKAEEDRIVAFAYGGKASIIAPISEKKFGKLRYNCEEEGIVTVGAYDIQGALTSLPPGNVEIKIENKELLVSLVSNPDFNRALATYQDNVKPPNIATKFTKEIKIKREIFIHGLKRVTFATAFEEKMWCYQCVVFEHTDKEVRFSAGSGGRFVVNAIEGDDISSSKKDHKIIFPHHNVPNMIRILSDASDPEIEIKYGQSIGEDAVPEQILIEFDGMSLCLFGIEAFTKYPDLNMVIEHQYPNRIFSELKEWDYVVKGVKMTYRGHTEDIHNTEVVFKPDKEAFITETKTAHKSKTPVNIVDSEKCIVKGDDIWFRCNSEYLEDMVTCGNHDAKVSINFESQAGIENEEQAKAIRPVLIKYPEKPDKAKGINEKFYLFFSTSSK